jgi:hypothetical protein
MIILSWLWSPVGRALSAVGAVLGAFLLVYWKGRAEGKDKLRWEQEDERQRRVQNALDADDRVRRDIANGRLFDDDGHRRN